MSLPYDKDRTNGLPSALYDTIDRLIQPALRYSHGLQGNNPDWDPAAIKRGAFILDELQTLLDNAGFRRSSHHYRFAETVSLLRHLSSALHGPLFLRKSPHYDVVRNLSVSGKGPTIGADLLSIITAFQPDMATYGNQLIEQAADYGWELRRDAQQIGTDNCNERIEANLLPEPITKAAAIKAMKAMRPLLATITTRTDAVFKPEANPTYDHTLKISASHSHQQLHDILESNKITRMYADVVQINEIYDNNLKWSSFEDETALRFRSATEGGQALLRSLCGVHHLYMRHIRRNIFPDTQQDLLDHFYAGPNAGMPKLIYLMGVSADSLMQHAYMNFGKMSI